jgi:hypothetical protein
MPYRELHTFNSVYNKFHLERGSELTNTAFYYVDILRPGLLLQSFAWVYTAWWVYTNLCAPKNTDGPLVSKKLEKEIGLLKSFQWNSDFNLNLLWWLCVICFDIWNFQPNNFCPEIWYQYRLDFKKRLLDTHIDYSLHTTSSNQCRDYFNHKESQ